MEIKFIMFSVLLLGLSLCGNVSESSKHSKQRNYEIEYEAIKCRSNVANLADFGAVGDGVTLNTDAFNKAIANLSLLAANGGALLFVPAGKWLTGSISLISYFTLYIHKDAVILASQKESDYPQIRALPSYGIGRDGGSTRFASLLFGTNLTDVVITGGNGTIEGQGEIWWKKFRGGKLKSTRPYLIEIMFSIGVQISNITLSNSPSWNVHPVYSKNVIIELLTITAPVTSPNTDGINPDSCTNTRIRDSYIISGDDCIAVKSGWDEYGIEFGMPTENLSIKNVLCISPDSAMIALGSEMSGGIRNVHVDGAHAVNTESAVRMKTAPGRGGFVKDIFVQNMKLETMKYVLWMTGTYGQHADDKWDPNAFPRVNNFNFRDIEATNVTMVGNLLGIAKHNFTGICVSNLTATMAAKGKKKPWNCSDIKGKTSLVSPPACELLPETKEAMDCDFPKHGLAIDKVELRKCYV